MRAGEGASSQWPPVCVRPRTCRSPRVLSAAAAVIVVMASGCGDERCYPPAGNGLINVDVCADTSPDATPVIGGVCIRWRCEAEVDRWDCTVETLEAGVCTFATLVGGQAVTYELLVIRKRRGPYEDVPTPPGDCCPERPVLGTCVDPADGGAG